MAADSPETFDFGSNEFYQYKDVAERAIWPLVNYIWRGDWRKDSADESKLTFPKKGYFEGRLLDVVIQAATSEWEKYDDESTYFTYGACLSVEEEIPVAGRPIALAGAKAAVNEIAKNRDEDDEPSPAWPEGDESKFGLRKGVAYEFDSDGDLGINIYRSVFGPYGHIEVPLSIEESEGTEDFVLRMHDLELIEAGCRLLKAPPSVIKALEDIKTQPVTIY